MAVNQISTFIPTLWAARLNANLDKALVLANIVNTSYQGEVRKGNTVRINRVGNIAALDYDPAVTTVTYAVPTASTQVLSIDARKYFGFQVDDLDAVQSNVALLNEYTQRAGYALADEIDKSIANLYTAAGAGDTAVDLTAAGDAYAALVTAGRKLSEQNVPMAGRWAVVSPFFHAALLGANSKLVQATDAGSSVVVSGMVGRAAGFDIYVSNNLVDSDGTAVIQRKCLVGSSVSIAHVRALEGAPEAIRLESKIATGVRGNIAWGNKVIEPLALGTITAKEA
jgi:P22 coat protein - gene protein 5